MSKRKIGADIEVENRGKATVLSHGKDRFGAYTEVRLEDGEVIKTHPSNIRKTRKKLVGKRKNAS